MSQKKKKGFFSWLGLGGKSNEEAINDAPDNPSKISENSAQSEQDSEHHATNRDQQDHNQTHEDRLEPSLADDPTLRNQTDGDLTSDNPSIVTENQARNQDLEGNSELENAESANVISLAEGETEPLSSAHSSMTLESEEAPSSSIDSFTATVSAESPLSEETHTPVTPLDSEGVHTSVAPEISNAETRQPTTEIEETEPLDVIAEQNDKAAEEMAEEKSEDKSDDNTISHHEENSPPKKGFFARLKESLVKTKQNIGSGFLSLFTGKKIDAELFEELEEQLLIADVGVETTNKIIKRLTEHATKHELKDASLLYDKLKDEMGQILTTVSQPLVIDGHKPFVILMIGVNGVGKTTTIGKLAKQFQAEGKSVMLAAGDTFRAAAVEQLQVWGERNGIPVIAQHTGADSASVLFDALEAAKARKVDVLIADTAGRLQNKSHLMDELKKIVRVMKKQDPEAPHEVMLTLDACTGQNAISQAQLFNEAVGITGLTLTKLDGTAKGGVIFALADKFAIPVRYIGVGEKIDDLRPFNGTEFIDALFDK